MTGAGGALSVGAVVGLAMVCAGAAGWPGSARDRRLVRRARGLLGGGKTAPAGPGGRAVPWWVGQVWRRSRAGREWWCLVAGFVVAVLGASVVPLLIGAAGVPVVRRAMGSGARRRARERRADEVIALCGVLAGEVRAGRQPAQALFTAARDTGGLGDAHACVLAAGRFGGDVPTALGAASRESGAEGLSGLAACWRVAVDRGAGLASGLERLEGSLRAERDQRAETRAQLAGARSTAVMLAGLPVLGLLLGGALGAAPLRVLLHTGAGLGCLAVGGALEGAGLWWALRIVRGAEEA
ncbi:type II secretion system F family protein [Streptomyces sp. NPDC058001]|uniref:type II secretion system F family protein n=1 Tax=Streptomyces sp. NPDC058001 TaxID=3346300 RepID=UPI0036E443DA